MDGLRPVLESVQSLVSILQTPPGYEVGTWMLAIVFLWAGAVKLARPALAALALADFRVVRDPKPWQGVALGLFEFCLGIAIVVGQGMAVVLGLAGAALAAFSLLVLRSLLAHESFACFCFGGEDESLSATTLVRTLLLAVLACVLWLAQMPVADRVSSAEQAYLTLLVATGVLSIILTLSLAPRLVRWNREIVAVFRARARECQ